MNKSKGEEEAEDANQWNEHQRLNDQTFEHIGQLRIQTKN